MCMCNVSIVVISDHGDQIVIIAYLIVYLAMCSNHATTAMGLHVYWIFLIG